MELSILILFVVIGTTIWVYFDAKSLGESPGGWLVGCILLWIVVFPIYLAKRKTFRGGKSHETIFPNDEQIPEDKRNA